MRIRPCIDIHNGKVKQIVGGTLRDAAGETPAPAGSGSSEAVDPGAKPQGAERETRSGSAARENYVSREDAAFYAELYREKGLPGGHIILLNSAKEEGAYEADRRQALGALRAFPGGMQIGGGITPETAPAFLDAGASHVIVTSYVFRDGRLNEENLERMVRAVGREHLVLDLSCRRAPDGRYIVVTDRWQKRTELAISAQVLTRLSACCDEFLIHAADVEGRRSGIETDLVRLLGGWQTSESGRKIAVAGRQTAEAGRQTAGVGRGRQARHAEDPSAGAPAAGAETPFPVTYAGGVHSVEDLLCIRALSRDAMDVTVGSALDLFGGNLSLEELTYAAGTER